MNDTMKIVKPLKESGLLIKGITETVKNEAKERKGGFLGMLLGTLGAIYIRKKLLQNLHSHVYLNEIRRYLWVSGQRKYC